MHKKIFYISLVVILISVLFILISIKPSNIKVALIKTSYNNILTSSEQLSIEVDIFVNKKTTDLTTLKKIKSVSIKNSDDLISARIDDITFLYEASINNDTFYKYRYLITSDYNYDLYMRESYLNIITSGNNYLFNIGSLSVASSNGYINNDLSINYLKGISKKHNDKSYLVGCYIGFDAKEDIKITNISFSDNNLLLSEIIKIDEFTYQYDFNLKKLVNEDAKFDEVSISGKEKFLLVFSYKELYQIPDTGIKIDYECNFGAKTMFYPKFTFFIDHEAKELVEDLDFYEFRNN